MLRPRKSSTNKSDTKKAFLEQAKERLLLANVHTTEYKFKIDKKTFSWSTNYEKISLIREGLPYAAIEAISKQTKIPVNHYLNSLGIVQTTYNKKKKSDGILSKQDSEFVVELIELYEFGLSVFNKESEKFQRWLRKSNISLGNASPDSFFDSLTGIREVKKALNRIEYGNMA